VLDALLAAEGDIVTVVDARTRGGSPRSPDRSIDWARCSRRFTGSYLDDDEPVTLSAIWSEAGDASDADGEFIGLIKLSADGAAAVRAELEQMAADGSLDGGDLPEVLSRLIANGRTIDVVYITGHWLDVDDAFDLANLRNMI
jgi:phosphoenolpyruvate phosphomutase